ncbi:FHA domain-containing protein [Neorhizobium alkalisoli]|uniref:FHA domain protein n=1 Tax=Neorhizobium alkalisoli TaxID=528178 RepID=A0A561QI82_9HYPH|nr:FHA domain-containing protein [Neorhizobium alkalisoli]TWF50061.1 FHA domain protein [Neorhizobium alkalisoli]
MRLELRQIGGNTPPSSSISSAARLKWYFERGRRTLGRSADCDWQLPQEQRSVSKLHCVIERDRDGFVLLDKSANGSKVDGIIVHEGETARLSDQSRLEVGGLAFSVSISGERSREIEDPEAGLALSDEPLTISAILADIAPGGSSAGGILGDREVEPWSMSSRDPDSKSTSRNVEIGWNGPPTLESATKLLPDDWNIDGDSSFGSHLEHGSATHVSVPISRPKPIAALDIVNDNIPAPEPEHEDLDEDFPRLSIGRSGELADRMEAVMARMEEAMENTFEVFDMAPPHPGGEPDMFGRSREDVLVSRAETLLAQQVWLANALDGLMQEAGRMMEPRILESRVEAAGRRLPWAKNRDFWQAYKAQFEKNGRPLSVRDIFRAAMTSETAAAENGHMNHNDEAGR